MKDIIHEVKSPLFAGINSEDRKAMLGCIGFHIGTFQKGDIVAFEEENIKHIGIIIPVPWISQKGRILWKFWFCALPLGRRLSARSAVLAAV